MKLNCYCKLEEELSMLMDRYSNKYKKKFTQIIKEEENLSKEWLSKVFEGFVKKEQNKLLDDYNYGKLNKHGYKTGLMVLNICYDKALNVL